MTVHVFTWPQIVLDSSIHAGTTGAQRGLFLYYYIFSKDVGLRAWVKVGRLIDTGSVQVVARMMIDGATGIHLIGSRWPDDTTNRVTESVYCLSCLVASV